jgi:hypothetical protein
MSGARSTIARAARKLLELHDQSPELWAAQVGIVLTPRDIDILREVATWDDYLRPKRDIAS